MKIANTFYSEIKSASATFGQRLLARRKALNWSQRDLAKKVEVSVNTIQSYENGSLPRGPHFLALTKVLGCSLNWLVGMNDAGELGGHVERPDLGPGGVINLSDPCRKLDYFFRPEFLNNHADEYSKHRTVSFNYRWLTEISTKPENLRLLIFKGPAMQPTIADGDLLMVDSGQTAIYSGYLYLIKTGGSQSINRLIVKPGNYLSIVSDNQAMCPPFNLPTTQVEIAGRIVWFSRSI